MTNRLLVVSAIIGAAALLSIGGAGAIIVYRYLNPPPKEEVVKPAPAKPQSDGSIIVERAPQKKPTKPKHKIPKGATEERRITATVESPKEGCPPVTVDLSIVKKGDGRRVIASSPDGKVIEALDVPIERTLIPQPHKKWAAGLSYGSEETIGLWVERDLGKRIVVGAELNDTDTGAEFRIKAGVRF